ncbi:MAG TPA: DUF47 family protein [Candidatus Bathyarchaeota archaeon]|nr:DUF47 family protein [Candidatus Bathyarchaeota archaeon]
MERWFARRRRNKVLDLAYRQMTLALDTVSELEKAIRMISKGKVKEAKARIDHLFLIEEDIDTLRRTVLEELTKGSLPAKTREDIMHLVKRLDVMADHVKDSARNVIILSEVELPADIWRRYGDLASDLVKCATLLRKSLEKLGNNPEEARRLSQEVDDAEKIADRKYLEIKTSLIKDWRELKAAPIMILKDLLDTMENIADTCDDTADYIRILTVPK